MALHQLRAVEQESAYDNGERAPKRPHGNYLEDPLGLVHQKPGEPRGKEPLNESDPCDQADEPGGVRADPVAALQRENREDDDHGTRRAHVRIVVHKMEKERNSSSTGNENGEPRDKGEHAGDGGEGGEFHNGLWYSQGGAKCIESKRALHSI